MIGQTVGSYNILEKVGEGGMGVVYRGEHQMIGRAAAIKVLLAEYSQSPNIVKRFFNEARAATAIKHPGIVDVFDFGHHTDGSAYIIMEMLQGEPLSHRLFRVGRLAVDHAVSVSIQIASALGAAHAAGIIHRDLKPDNVYLVPDPLVPFGDRVKLLDFGIAKLSEDLRGDLDATRAGAILGTPQYMAPEQCMGLQGVDHRADMYALGCLIFHLLCGRPPFTSEEIGKVSIEHMTQPPPKPRDLDPAIPEALQSVVLRLLEKAPEARFQSCGQLIDALEGKPPRAATPVPPPMVAVPNAPTLRDEDEPTGGPPDPVGPDGKTQLMTAPVPLPVQDEVSGDLSGRTELMPTPPVHNFEEEVSGPYPTPAPTPAPVPTPAPDDKPEPFIARWAVPLALLASLIIGGIAFAVCNA